MQPEPNNSSAGQNKILLGFPFIILCRQPYRKVVKVVVSSLTHKMHPLECSALRMFPFEPLFLSAIRQY